MLKISYIADGFQNEFAFDFEFFQPRDVRVAVNDSMLSAAEYNLAHAEDNTRGGVISFANPPAEGNRIDIFRRIYLERFISYQPTAKIEPEALNADFRFLLEAFKDLKGVEIDLAEWKNIHDNVIRLLESALSSGIVKMNEDYGSITEQAVA